MIRHDEDTLVNPSINKLLDKIPQKYHLVLAATRRAKQIIRENRLNPEGIPENEQKRKPLTIALHEIADGKIDEQAIMSPDIVFDEFEEAEAAQFPSQTLPEATEDPQQAILEAKPVEPEIEVEDDDDEDLSEIDDLFDLGTDKDLGD